MKLYKFYYFIGILLFVSLVSCVNLAPTHEIHLVDSLNTEAYRMRYIDVDSSAKLALRAFHSYRFYDIGKAEACNNLAFCFYIKMDFEQAERLYKQVTSITKNETELLVADVGLMMIYQRTAMNKAFYDRKNDAKRRMKRIDEESYQYISPHDTQRLKFAYSEYNIVSAIYYYYLRQHDKAVDAINSIDDKQLSKDSCQWMYYHYIKGSAGLCSGSTHDEQLLNCFDELFATWKVASRRKVIYFEANSLQGLSNLMSLNDAFLFFKYRRGYMLSELGMPIDTLIALHMAQSSLVMFKKYHDLYQTAGTYVSIAKYYNIHGRYKEAFNVLCKALQCVNDHHRLYYRHYNSSDTLFPFTSSGSVSTELKWISREKAKTVPEWILSIREQLSVTYAGMGNKIASDYNRNVYLDILNYTRQDKELENRYNALQEQLQNLNVVFGITLAGLFLAIFLLWLFNRRARIRDQRHTVRLRKALKECRKITTYSSEQAVAKLNELKQMELRSKEDRMMAHVLMPYVSWVIDNRKTLLMLSEEQERLNKERYVLEKHIAENKRQNITKKTCLAIVNGINPYIDRILNEVRKLQSSNYGNDLKIRKERLQYIDELVTTINEYNEILTLWIKMRQGSLSLNIENFELNELFSVLEKGHRAFELKHLKFQVDKTDAVVKADKALTLFMINTLAENARKYTSKGGSVRVSAKSEEHYVEISVEDTGRGLSAEDMREIIGEKVYDSSKIGMNDSTDLESLKKNKGSGFGLMNCKGIIEKYRKTSPLFDVCLFSVDSTLGKGSRFFFRIPKGVRKVFTILFFLLLPMALQSCHHEDERKDQRAAIDSIAKIEKKPGFENLLNKASHDADMAYYSNVQHKYERALLYADSAIVCLNAHYRKYSHPPYSFMTLKGVGTSAEIEWWNKMFDSDFHVILDIRNESAVAFLALKQLDGYQYNNDAYTSLYKLLGEDKSLSEYCRHLQQSATDKKMELTFCLLLVIIIGVGYYFIVFRKRTINRMNLEQVFTINETILKASLQPLIEMKGEALQNVEDTLTDIPRNIVNSSFDGVNELVPINRLGLAVYTQMSKSPAFVCNPPLQEMPFGVQNCYNTRNTVTDGNHEMFPLLVDTSEGQNCVGVLYMEIREGIDLGSDRLLVQLIAEYMAIVVLNSILNLASNYGNIESANEEVERTSFEDNLLHVQNMVLDNCLSTIKHETIYYPNKIKQIITRLNGGESERIEAKKSIESISELIEYYRDIFTIMSSCASRQLEEVTFRRSIIAVSFLTDYASDYFRKMNKQRDGLTLTVELVDAKLIGDVILLQFLLENLIDEALNTDLNGKLILQVKEEKDFIRFDFIDMRRTFSRDVLNQMFYPQRERMNYLICRQIVREHDEYVGQRGCRINAEPYAEGFSIYFTLTKK